MKKVYKIMFGMLMVSLLFSTFSTSNVLAAESPASTVEVGGDTHQAQVSANIRTAYRFRQRTQLTFNSNVNIDVNMNCDAMNIGDKNFEIEVDGTNDLTMTMTCTENQEELGLMDGQITQTRNRNRYQYRKGFVISVQCNDSCNATMKLEATEADRGSTWAYYDTQTSEWVSVETTLKDGYLVAETDHFSTWTVLSLETDYTILIIGIGIGAVVIIGITVVLKKRKD